MDVIEKLRGKVDRGEIYFVESLSREVQFKGWKIRSSESKQQRGYGVRVIVDGKVGTAGTTDPNALDETIDDAISAAKFGEKLDLELPGKSEFSVPEIYDEKVTQLGIERMTDYGKELMSRLEKYRNEADCEIGISTNQSVVRIANTEGFYGEYKKTAFALSAEIMRVKEGDIYIAWDYIHLTSLPSIEEAVDKITRRIDDIMQYRDQIVKAPSGRVPVVFSPYGTYAVFLPLSVGVNGMNIYTKASPVHDKLGQKLFDEKLTIVNDGTISGRPGTAPFDDEGVVVKKFPVVENGVLTNFVLDLTTAKKSGYKSNGCAQRSIFSPPIPAFANVIIQPGETSLSDLIGDIKEGLLVDFVLGMGQGNILSGAFSNPVSTGFKIENGKIVGRVKNVAIAGNIYENLKEIAGISKEALWAHGSYYSPYIRLDNISVVSK